MGFFISDDQKAKLKKTAADSASRLRRLGKFEILVGAGLAVVSMGIAVTGLTLVAMPLAALTGATVSTGTGRFATAKLLDHMGANAGTEGQFSDLSERQMQEEKIQLASLAGVALGLVSFFTSSLFPPVAPLMMIGGLALAASAHAVAETAKTTKQEIAGYLGDLTKATEFKDSAAPAAAQPEAALAGKGAAPGFNAAAPVPANDTAPAAAAPKPVAVRTMFGS